MARHEVLIEDDGTGYGRVVIDGMEIEAVSYAVRGAVETIQKVTVEFYAHATVRHVERAADVG